MKPHLLYRNDAFDWSKQLPWNAAALDSDLSLETLFTAMAQGDAVIFDAVQKAILGSTTADRESILYRQDVLREGLHHETTMHELYAIATEAMDKEKKHYLGTLARYPHWVLRDAVEQMEMFGGLLRKLRAVSDSQGRHFVSEGWTAFFGNIQDELTDEYFHDMASHLGALKLHGPTLLSAGLDEAGRPANYALHRSQSAQKSFWEKLWTWLFGAKPSPNSFSINPRDEAGMRAIERIRDDGIAFVAAALAQTRDYIRDFFADLRSEIAFYLGCANLYRAITEKGGSICFPTPVQNAEPLLAFRGLYDAGLALTIKGRVVGNDLDTQGCGLVIITGANQGGKSTFLRSVGLAQIMMQAGLFVTAETFCTSLCRGIFTHYAREESAALESGKFDEELARMSAIVDRLARTSLVLLNESFAATNEREGSEVGYQVINGLLDRGVRVICVTHLYDLARRLFEDRKETAHFLRPERLADGSRTFRLIAGEPLATSFGADLYRTIFSTPASRQHGERHG